MTNALESPFAQSGYRCRLEWGRRGAREATERGDVLVVVDVLSFTSCVVTAVARGGLIRPCLNAEEAERLQAAWGGVVAARRRETSAQHPYSLSPVSFLTMPPETRVLLPSPNGATCCRLAGTDGLVIAGALLNAGAVAGYLSGLLAQDSNTAITVLASGERWQTPSEDGDLRFALEDYLGAGAILSGLPAALLSPEAHLCANAFHSSRSDLESLLWECASGRELRSRGYSEDVLHASRLDLYTVIPVQRQNVFTDYSASDNSD